MSFHKLGLDKKLLDEIHQMGFLEATPIQSSCIPLILQGHDIIGQSLTGSGKTAAFGLPILHKVVSGNGVQSLILAPTRELAQQVREHLNTIGKKMKLEIVCVYGGVGIDRQIKSLRRADIVVATPGRLLDHLQRKTVDLKKVKFLVLDEADRMLDMGFSKDIEKILSQTPKDRQTILFSATFPPLARKLAQKYLSNPKHIKEKEHVDTSLLSHKFYSVDRERKFSLLVHLLNSARGNAIVFCRTKREVDKIAKNLRKQNFDSMAIHGDIPQNKRQKAVEMFRDGQLDVLVATDVAARGIDIKGISHVYNYDVPEDAEDYTHRVGRTARAGMKGEAITILTRKDEEKFWHISDKIEILSERLPDFEQIRLISTEHYTGRGPPRRRFNSTSPRNSFSDQKRGARSGGRRSSAPRRRKETGDGFRDQVSTYKKRSYGGESNNDSFGDSAPRRSYSRSPSSGPSRWPSRSGFSKPRSGSGPRSGGARSSPGSPFKGSFSKPKSSSPRSSSKPKPSFGGRDSRKPGPPKDRSARPRAPRSSAPKTGKKFYEKRR